MKLFIAMVSRLSSPVVRGFDARTSKAPASPRRPGAGTTLGRLVTLTKRTGVSPTTFRVKPIPAA